MENTKLKQVIQEQGKLVQIELQATGQGYAQALGWVLALLDKEAKQGSETVGGPTIIKEQEKE